jgi:hypothetical protein
MRPSSHRWLRSVVLAVVLACPPLLLTGCQSAMPNSHTAADARGSSLPGRPSWEWPLRFRTHNFAAFCYDTYGCKVHYAGLWDIDEDPQILQPSSASYGVDYQRGWLGGHLGIENFPSPVEVSWRSKDGQPHAARIDIGAIFADQLIRHRVPRAEIPEDASIPDPDIVLEINDRTINVYMRGFVPTRTLQIPGNRYSDARDDLILVHTEVF